MKSMDNFFKRCGIGIVVIVTSPFWLAYFALYILYASIGLILSPLKILIYALNHRNYSIKSHYDVEAEERLNANNNPQTNNFVSPFSNNSYYPPNQPQVPPTPPQQPLNISINLVNPNQNNQDGNSQNNPNQNNYNQPNTQAYIDYSNQNGQLTNNNPPEINNQNNYQNNGQNNYQNNGQNPSNYDINGGGNYNG